MISGITATLSSVMVPIIVIFANSDEPAQFCTNIDLIVNAICVVATFKFHCIMCDSDNNPGQSQTDELDSKQVDQFLNLFDQDGNLTLKNSRMEMVEENAENQSLS